MKVRDIDIVAAHHHTSYATVFTANGSVEAKSFYAVFDRGGTGERISSVFPEIRRQLGKLIDVNGNHCYVLPVTQQKGVGVVSMPTKHLKGTGADLALIQQSCVELVMLADIYGWEKVFLPRAGCGNGKLDWQTQVRPIFMQAFDDRFVVVHDSKRHAAREKARKKKAKTTKPVFKRGAVSEAAKKRMKA